MTPDNSWTDALPSYRALLNISNDTRSYWMLSRRKRVAEVVLLLQHPNGRYLVHTKDFYPPGTWRLMTGGVHPGEDLTQAAIRETTEETGLLARVVQPIARIAYDFLNKSGPLYFSSYLYLIREFEGALSARDSGEQISGYREVELDELEALATQLELLQGDDWADWGRFRAVGHHIAYHLLKGQADAS